eukprot:6816024-Pyramimonas_sp.AAC.1
MRGPSPVITQDNGRFLERSHRGYQRHPRQPQYKSCCEPSSATACGGEDGQREHVGACHPSQLASNPFPPPPTPSDRGSARAVLYRAGSRRRTPYQSGPPAAGMQ